MHECTFCSIAKQLSVLIFFSILLFGCVSNPSNVSKAQKPEFGLNYIYQPLNPTTIWIRDPTEKEKSNGLRDADETSYNFNKALLRDLDTETVRISLDKVNANFNINKSIVGVSVEGQSYILIVDYIKYFTHSRKISTEYKVVDSNFKERKEKFDGAIPIYAGIGLRVRAEFRANESGINISGLPAIAMASSLNQISGRLTVQTLGVSGPEITALMPIITDISVTSIQNAVQAVGAIKAKLYEESTTLYPKLVGFESPGNSPGLIRHITEQLYASEEYIMPTVITNPEDNTKDIHWIDWFSSPPKEITQVAEID